MIILYCKIPDPKVQGIPPASTQNPTAMRPMTFKSADHGAIIVTTRSSTVNLGQPIFLGKLTDVNDSLEILASASRRAGLKEDISHSQSLNKSRPSSFRSCTTTWWASSSSGKCWRILKEIVSVLRGSTFNFRINPGSSYTKRHRG
ncbi:hypothetical protein N7451_011873 [Penicillium sp. IBT 35674x]|nr:hypothetical protein N7451_011873 [Penicillium sp. IBT 35674x]